MPRGNILSAEEQGKIQAFHEEKLSNRAIAKKIGRSLCVVNNFLKLRSNYGTKKSSGRTPTLSPRQKSLIIRTAARENVFAGQIKDQLALPVSKRRVQQVLQSSKYLKFTKRMACPALSKEHKLKRLDWAKNHMDYGEKWKNVIFSDEKKFNLDGPDGFQYYWRDLRKEKEVRMSRNFGGGTLMIWGAFSFHGKLPLAWISTRMNSESYVEMLEISLIEHGENLMGPDLVFQQDNAAIHNSRTTKEWFLSKNIEVLNWPSRSPDLNPIENLWGILARKVYANGKQYDNVNSLKDAIRTEWSAISMEVLENLVKSMKTRIFDVIKCKGGNINY